MIRNEIPPEIIDQLVFGQVVQMPAAPNIAREIVLGAGLSVKTDAYSVTRACATSLQANASSNPPPKQAPLMAATTGKG